MSKALADIQDLIKTPSGQLQFIEWYGNDFTQRMLAAAKDIVRPYAPQGTCADAVQVSLALGESVGGYRVLDFFTNPQGTLPPTARLVADYGARKLMKETK